MECSDYAQTEDGIQAMHLDWRFDRNLVDMYAKCGCLQEAQKVFVELPFQNVISWNALFGGYVEHGGGDQTLICYERMQ